MTERFAELFGAQPGQASRFAPTSRYATLPTRETTLPDGRTVRYVARRLLADPASLGTAAEHVVGAGERLDLVAAAVLGDPELYWRIADGHLVVHPDDLVTEQGRVLRVPLPPGVPGVPDVR